MNNDKLPVSDATELTDTDLEAASGGIIPFVVAGFAVVAGTIWVVHKLSSKE
jgi:lactobin A/cerein 7B family class IIb bacteriocin